jgi:dolichyl-phosphate-mannose--protein O-mannosyl transferase
MKHKFLLLIILLFALTTRFINLSNPPTYYFDEVYHGVTAKAYAQNNPEGYEWWHDAPEPNTAYEWLHPPVGKLFMAVGWKYLGQSAWAWRVPGALIGVGVILLVFCLSLALFNNRALALLAALLASLDGLLLSQSRIGMNDIYVTFFILATVYAYVESRKRDSNVLLLLSGVLAGIAMSTKWSGVFTIGMIGSWELVLWYTTGIQWFKRLPKLLLIFGILPFIIYVGSYGQFWLQGHTISQFKELHSQIWYYQTHLTATHSYQSKAWEWPLAIRPVWYYVNYYGNGTISNIYNLANPLLAWIGLVAVLGLFFHIKWNKKSLQPLQPAVVLLIYYVWSWMPWLISPRIMFYYHYTPAIPVLCIALASQLKHIWFNGIYGKWMSVLIITAIVITFFWLLPMWINVPLPESWWKWLFWLPSWK